MVKMIEDGGVGMINLNSFEKVFKLKWMNNLAPLDYGKLAPKHIDIRSVLDV